jgi:mannose-6-phosphate isomerase-like protein (cupin superfamily)
MTDIITASSNKLDSWGDSGPWYEGTHGERIAVRVSSLDTNGTYAVVGSIAAPGCATPMHLHRNEAGHFVIITGSYRIAIGEKIYEVSAGASIILPKGVPHSWRNISSESGRMVVILNSRGIRAMCPDHPQQPFRTA